SAINDTTREVGGALGIAILGSIGSAVYRSTVSLSGLELSPSATKEARESVGGAAQVAHQVPNGARLVARAGSAFIDAFHVTVSVGAALALIAAVVVVSVFNRKSEQTATEENRGAAVGAAA